MNRHDIKQHLTGVLEDWLGTLEDNKLKSQVQNHCFFAGGAIASLLTDTPVNDYDIYFDDATALLRVAGYYVNQWDSHHTEHPVDVTLDGGKVKLSMCKEGKASVPTTEDTKPYEPVCFTDNAITLYGPQGNIQIITRFIGAPATITHQFDFAHTTCFYTPGSYLSDGHLVLPVEAVESIATHELVYTGSAYPLSSLIRTRKFIQRGWKCNAGQYLKMGLQLHALDLTDLDTLRDQLVGIDMDYFSRLLNSLDAMKGKKDRYRKEQDRPFYNPFPAGEDDLGTFLLDLVNEIWG